MLQESSICHFTSPKGFRAVSHTFQKRENISQNKVLYILYQGKAENLDCQFSAKYPYSFHPYRRTNLQLRAGLVHVLNLIVLIIFRYNGGRDISERKVT